MSGEELSNSDGLKKISKRDENGQKHQKGLYETLNSPDGVSSDQLSRKHVDLHKLVVSTILYSSENKINIVLYPGNPNVFLRDHNYSTIECTNLNIEKFWLDVAGLVIDIANNHLSHNDIDTPHYIYLSGRVDVIGKLYDEDNDASSDGYFLEKSFDMLKNDLHKKMQGSTWDIQKIFTSFVFICDPKDKGKGSTNRNNFTEADI